MMVLITGMCHAAIPPHANPPVNIGRMGIFVWGVFFKAGKRCVLMEGGTARVDYVQVGSFYRLSQNIIPPSFLAYPLFSSGKIDVTSDSVLETC